MLSERNCCIPTKEDHQRATILLVVFSFKYIRYIVSRSLTNMTTPTIRLIYASTLDGVIGFRGKIPWRVPEDLAIFREKTINQTVLMGRKTYDSLPPKYKPLPNRTSVVATRNTNLYLPDVQLTQDPVNYLQNTTEDVWVIGGTAMYKLAYPLCTEVHHTEICSVIKGDSYFAFDRSGWEVVSETNRLKSDSGMTYRIRVLRRR
jgi:dihydrofolate reductase